MLKVACVGIAVQDRIYRVEKLPSGGGKNVAQDYFEVGGGPAATAAVAIARLGGSPFFIGRIGDDPAGDTILSELKSEGVKTNYTRVISGAKSSQSAILVDAEGERMIINYPSPDLVADTEWLDEIDFSAFDVVLADVRWHQGTKRSFELAREVGVPTILDADLTPQDITPLVQLADHIVFSDPGLKKLTKIENYHDALQAVTKISSGVPYVTAGKEGCFWMDDKTIVKAPGFTVEVVDTTGAGDVFHGAFAYGIAEGMSVQQTVQFANAVAAVKCAQPGGRAGIPNKQQTLDFLQKNNLYVKDMTP